MQLDRELEAYRAVGTGSTTRLVRSRAARSVLAQSLRAQQQQQQQHDMTNFAEDDDDILADL